MKVQTSKIALVAVGFILAYVSTFASRAEAVQVMQLSATACTAPGYNSFYNWNFSAGRMYNANTTTSLSVSCPFPSTLSFSHSNVTELLVDVYENYTTDQIEARACITRWDGGGHACGTAASSGTSFTGYFSISAPLTYWGSSYSDDYPYVLVTLPASTGGSAYVHGMYITAP